MTVVERQVAAMLRKQREEQDEQAALARRAEELRSRGEQALDDNGDLDVDSDSEHDDLERRGATGRARREFRDRGIVFDSSTDEVTVTVRAMTDLELGMAFAWMRRDQRRYEGATSFWSKAGTGIQECFEEERCPGDKDVHAAVGAWPRLTGAFVPFLGPAPFAFAMLKDDGLTVDTMGVRQGFRRMGLGKNGRERVHRQGQARREGTRRSARVRHRRRARRGRVLARDGLLQSRRGGLADDSRDAEALRRRRHVDDAAGGSPDAARARVVVREARGGERVLVRRQLVTSRSDVAFIDRRRTGKTLRMNQSSKTS